MTANGLTTSLSWTDYLQPSGATGPSRESTSVFYNGIGRPDHATGRYGASITYSYSDSPSGPNRTE